MNILRTLDSIKANAWGQASDGNCILNTSPPVPLYEPWDYTKPIKIENINLWEQLYHESGNLGLFASWSPYIECYLLVYYPFLNTQKGMKIFYGTDACYNVSSIMNDLSIHFEVRKINLPSIAI